MRVAALAYITGAFLLFSGCVATPNPQFSDCSNSCTEKQDACMVNASTAGDIANCNGSLEQCVAQCEQRFPRYLH